MKRHILFPIFLVTGGLLVLGLSLWPVGNPTETPVEGMAIIYQSQFELPSYSGGSSSRIIVRDFDVPLLNPTIGQRTNGVPFAELEFRFAMVENQRVRIDHNETRHSSDDFIYGNFRAPREDCSTGRLVYNICQDSTGFYLANTDDLRSVRHRFESNDEFEIMWEVDRVISASVFPYDVCELLANSENSG